MKVTVLNYTGDRDNWGCQATSRELLRFLEDALAPAKPDFVLVPMLDRTGAYPFVQRRMEEGLRRAMRQRRLGPWSAAKLLWAGLILHGRLVWHVLTSRYVVFQAEGTMAGTDLLKGTSLLILPTIAARLFRKKVVSLNQTIFSADPDFDSVLTRCLESFRLVAVREAASYHYARSLGVDDVRLIPDTAFRTKPSAVEPRSLIEPEFEGDYFCVAGSSIIQFIELEAFVNVVRETSEHHHLRPVLLLSSKQDEVLRKRLAASLPTVHVVRASASHNDVARVLAEARFLVGGRYHMSVLAGAVGTPIVSIPANTFKNEGLVELLDYPLPVRRPSELTAIRDDIDQVLSRRGHFSEIVRRGHERISAMLDQGGRLLRQRLSLDDSNEVDFDALTPASTRESGIDHATLEEYQRFQVEIDTKRGLIRAETTTN